MLICTCVMYLPAQVLRFWGPCSKMYGQVFIGCAQRRPTQNQESDVHAKDFPTYFGFELRRRPCMTAHHPRLTVLAGSVRCHGATTLDKETLCM